MASKMLSAIKIHVINQLLIKKSTYYSISKLEHKFLTPLTQKTLVDSVVIILSKH